MRTTLRVSWIATLVSTLVVAACQPITNRLGADVAAPVTLSAESVFDIDEVEPFAAALDAVSDGDLRLAITDQVGAFAPGSEEMVVEHVRAGTIDVGFVGTRVWPTLGVRSFDALQAPLLIDDYALQERVLGDPLMEALGSDLAPLGLVSVGVLPGPLRFPLGRDRAFISPLDFAGASIGFARAAVTEATLAALGARASEIAGGAPIDRYVGIESQVSVILSSGYQDTLQYITGNLVLWPRTISVVMTGDRFEMLTERERDWLQEALRSSRPILTDRVRSFEDEALGTACRSGVQVVAASDGDLSRLAAALEPVYADLRRDDATRSALDAITALKDGPAAPLRCPEATATDVPTVDATPIDGSWEQCPTAADIIAAGGDVGEARDNAGCTTITFRRGVFSETGSAAVGGLDGRYRIDGDQLAIERSNGEVFWFTWSLFRDRLTLDVPADPSAISPAPLRALPMTRVGG